MKIIDIHNHIIFRFKNDLEDLLNFATKAKKLGVSMIGISLNTTIKEMQEGIMDFKNNKNQDPYFKWNFNMMESLKSKKVFIEVFPFLYLPPEINLAKKSMEKYESIFRGKKFGYKIHSQGIREEIQNLRGINSHRPIIIHSSIDYSSPEDILKYFSDYEGNVLLAHFAKFDIKSLKQIKNLPNFFIDSSISTIMFEALKSKSPRIYYSEELSKVKSPLDLYLSVGKICGFGKILFATDYPLSQTPRDLYKKEIEVLLKIPQKQREKISYKNTLKFLNVLSLKNN